MISFVDLGAANDYWQANFDPAGDAQVVAGYLLGSGSFIDPALGYRVSAGETPGWLAAAIKAWDNPTLLAHIHREYTEVNPVSPYQANYAVWRDQVEPAIRQRLAQFGGAGSVPATAGLATPGPTGSAPAPGAGLLLVALAGVALVLVLRKR